MTNHLDRRGISSVALGIVMLMSLGASPGRAVTLSVNNGVACSDGTGTPYCHIQAAINAASSGDTINVYPGTYSETAVAPSPPACTGDTVGLYIGTNGITIQGVDGGGAPITDPTLAAATVNTNSNLCFGPDGFFVTGDNVTIAGILVGTNTGGQNKTIEIAGDNFTLKNCDIADLQGSIYFNDFTCNDALATTSHIQSYTIQGNIFEDGVSLDITNGAGLSGPASGRVVTGNTFRNLATAVGAEPWPSVSFNGSGTGVPWFVCSVGGAAITSNTFSDSAPDGQLIRARGTYDNSQFDWASYWNSNTFNKAAVVGSTPPAVVETYSYPNSYGTFKNVRRIGAIIQGEVDHAQANDTVLVAAGTYPENVVISTTGLTLAGAGQGLSTILPAVSNPNPCTGSSLCGGAASNIILVQADNVTIQDFTLDGDNLNLPPSGIVRDGVKLDARNGIITNCNLGDVHNLDVHNTTVENVYLRGIYSCSGGSNTFNFHDNTVRNVQGDSSSIGMFAFAASGSMTHNTVSDAGDAISANWSLGINFINNTVSNSGSGVHTDNSGGSNFADVIQGNNISNCTPGGYGIFTFAPYVSPTVRSNTVTNCDVGLAASGGGGVSTAFSDNVVDGTHRPGSVGAYVTTSQFGYGSANVSATFIGNLIENTTDGFQLQDKTCSATTTQGCKTNSDCPHGETCSVGFTLTVDTTCNRIVDNGTGILTEALASPALATFSSNVIEGNGVGIDGSALPAGPALDAQNNFWGCAAGPGNAGCDTAVGNVAVLPVAAAAPVCGAYCTVDSQCDDGLFCNGKETCNLSTNTCQASAPVDCTAFNDACNTGTCDEPIFPSTQPSCTATAKPNGTSCAGSGGASCQAGSCTGAANSLVVAKVRLRRNSGPVSKPNRSNGTLYVLGVVNDEDTNGQLPTNLTSGGVTLEVRDNAHFHAVVTFTQCVAHGRTMTCNDRSTKTTASFSKLPYYSAAFGLLYKMTVSRQGLTTADTGSVLPSGPVEVILHQSTPQLDRPDMITGTNCTKSGLYTLYCHN